MFSVAARRSLRAQIVKLERELADAFVTAAADGRPDAAPAPAAPACRGCWTWASSSASATIWPSALHAARA